MNCTINYVGKSRNGKPKYWCSTHHAPVLIADGMPLDVCQNSSPQHEVQDVFRISPNEYPGGIALWGALPAVYDTTPFSMDFGIHVHARKEVGGHKVYDKTFARVAVTSSEGDVEFDAIAAVSYVFANVLNLPITYIKCPKCAYPHLDKDWFSVNPHKKHLCSGCGREFFDDKISVGNPIMKAKEVFGDYSVNREIVHPHRTLTIKQSDFPYGIAIWGSNTAMLWTSPKQEEYGIHIHAYKENSRTPTIDETYDSVKIDDIKIEVEHVRMYMIQNAMPFLHGRIESLLCPHCGNPIFEAGAKGVQLKTSHICESCGTEIKTKRKVVCNPIASILNRLEENSGTKMKKIDLLEAYPMIKGW